ncbi:MAG: DNA polymerase III subunit beta [Pseudomonadota bacterium]
MRVTLERSQLLKSLGHVHRVVERRNTIPILSNVLIRADGAQVHFKATDLDLEVTETAPCVVEQAGDVTVPAHMLHDIVRKLPDGSEVMLDAGTGEPTMVLKASRSNFKLGVLPASDFPDLTDATFSHTFEMKAPDLKRLIDQTQFAISTEETRYYLNGIFLHTIEDEGSELLRAVATDGHRLARVQIDAPAGSSGMPGIIVPRKAVAEIQRLVEDPDAVVKVELSETKIRFTVGSVVLTSKLIDGTFPDYNRVIPKDNDKRLVMDRSAFSSAVDRVSTISSERGRAVKMAIEADQLTLTVNNPESGTATEEVAVEFGADPIEIGFNSKYLLDISGQLKSDEAHMLLADPGSPTIIRDAKDDGALFVLMPMRV